MMRLSVRCAHVPKDNVIEQKSILGPNNNNGRCLIYHPEKNF
jgi:hypothetical protein